MRAAWALALAALAGVLAFLTWALLRGGPETGGGVRAWTGGSPHILAAMAIAVLGAGGLAGGLIWLAFFSARRGYDDRAGEWDDDGAGPRPPP